MTRFSKIVIAMLFVSLNSFMPFGNTVNGQPPSPPPGLTSSGQGSNSAEQAPSAPVGGGLILLITLGVMYSGKKMLNTDPENQD